MSSDRCGLLRVLEKESEKVERYTDLAIEIKTLWNMKSAKITTVVIGALGTVSNSVRSTANKLVPPLRWKRFRRGYTVVMMLLK